MAVQIASLPDSIRGFGHVKERNAETYERERAALLRRFEHPEPALPVAAACLAVAMAAIGLGTDLRKLRGLGLRPLAVGFAAALTTGAVATALIRLV